MKWGPQAGTSVSENPPKMRACFSPKRLQLVSEIIVSFFAADFRFNIQPVKYLQARCLNFQPVGIDDVNIPYMYSCLAVVASWALISHLWSETNLMHLEMAIFWGEWVRFPGW